MATGTQTGNPYLRIANVIKKFGDFTALDDVSIEIDEGEFVCFLGPSGCGKTTLLRAIAGLELQTYGRIEQAGRDISALPPSARDFGIVFQSYALFPNLSVFRNIAYGLENRKLQKAEIDSRVHDLLELVGLTGQDDKYPAQLSGGQQQRVALARALATSPGLLLLDEPLSALDARVRVHLRHEIKDLQNRLGVTTIMVTHDQEEALTMADRIVVMNHGVIEQVGTPVAIYRNPATAFVADFIGKMNFVDGTIAGAGRVRLGDVELACDTDDLQSGVTVQVAVRPEDIVARNVAASQDNAFVATVADLEFLGSSLRVELTGKGLGDRRLIADLSVNLMRELALEPGHDVMVCIPAERIRLYAAGR
ncbi:MAG: putative 2-aminoethylphosphonate ABC transporter ATP-binding protein [Rhodospirillales bacterium]|nr:MAG: putative 2-aminoethylphosphonate ABC transporter ATP-binding protein [Rhodospirillales bacterium]